jgi:hypothetical protein
VCVSGELNKKKIKKKNDTKKVNQFIIMMLALSPSNDDLSLGSLTISRMSEDQLSGTVSDDLVFILLFRFEITVIMIDVWV